MADKKTQLIIKNNTPIELPVLTNTVDPDIINMRNLTTTNRFTFDPNFISTTSCESKITYIDDNQNILLHHGYPIEQRAYRDWETDRKSVV